MHCCEGQYSAQNCLLLRQLATFLEITLTTEKYIKMPKINILCIFGCTLF